ALAGRTTERQRGGPPRDGRNGHRRRHRHGGNRADRHALRRGPGGRDPAGRARGRRCPPGCARRRPAAERRAGAVRLHRAGGHGRRVERHLPAVWPRLRGAAAGALHRDAADGVRHRPVRHGPLLLPRRPEGVHRPRLLQRPGAHVRRARRQRLRAGVRDRPRGRPPRADAAGHVGARGGGVAGRARGGGQRPLRAPGAAGRLLRRRVGAPQQDPARSRRRGGGPRRRHGHRRRPAPAAEPGADRPRVVHARLVRPARPVVPARAGQRRRAPVRYVRHGETV
ncbi:MAG: YpfJ protein, zinc metalloprotease superfamily, partial [uncultured Gemmatimonadetes bacterium]